MSLKRDLFELKRMGREIELHLYNIYISYLNGKREFPYDEINILLDKYELFYSKVNRKKNSYINKVLSVISVDSIKDDFVILSREMICRKVSKKIFSLILFDADKYVPVDDEGKELISDKLFPIAKNLSIDEIVDIYTKMKKSASIRGVVFDDNMLALLQQIFVGYIMSVLSHNLDNKYNSVRTLWTYEEVCKNILNESVLCINNSKVVKK